MEIYDYTVEKEESGIRIDRYLAEKDSGLSRSFLQKLLKEGQITVFWIISILWNTTATQLKTSNPVSNPGRAL